MMRFVVRANRLIFGYEKHEIAAPARVDAWKLPYINFTKAEEKRGSRELKKIVFPPDTPFVCLIIRDSAYLKSHIPDADFGYHDYRDCDIDNYVLAAETLAERGYYVFRMGTKVEKEFKSDHPRVIDYATTMRSDFMDIYLAAKCAFCISTSTGLDSVPIAFQKPVVITNLIPFIHAKVSNERIITIPKHILMNGEKLMFREMLKLRSLKAEGYADVELVENTPEEIRDVVIEMDDRIQGVWDVQEGDNDRQKRFWRQFPCDSSKAGSSRIGANYLRDNEGLL